VFRFNDMLRLNCLDPNSPNRVLCNDTLLSAPEAVADNIRSGGNRTASAAAAVAEGAHSLTAEELIKADDAKYVPAFLPSQKIGHGKEWASNKRIA
jgi:hypothetical protein